MIGRSGTPGRPRNDATAMTAVDSIDDRAHVVIADVGTDGAWLAMPESETTALERWR